MRAVMNPTAWCEKSVDHSNSPTDQRGTHAGHLMRCRSRNSLGFDLISLAFFGPLFMAPGRFRPFPLPLLACPGRAKNRRGAGLVRSGARWHSQGSTT